MSFLVFFILKDDTGSSMHLQTSICQVFGYSKTVCYRIPLSTFNKLEAKTVDFLWVRK